MAKPDKAKMDSVAKRVENFTNKLAKIQTKIDEINADGQITPEEQTELNELETELANFQAKIDKLTGITT
jgi:peptidoglycan hydrolase CwlO-like protein